MKRTIAFFLMLTVLCAATACGKPQKPVDMEPKVSQMRSICELAVMECYYHNVAKFTQEDADGFLWWKKDKRFWIEYSGVVKLGVDMSLVNMEISDTRMTITLPAAKVLGCKVDAASLNEDSYFVDQQSAGIGAEDEVAAFTEAQRQLEENVAADRMLLASAQQRAQDLLEGYVRNIGCVVGKEYEIMWTYLDADGAPLESIPDAPAAPTQEPAADEDAA
ncbi:MAG: DUF4230 domain-containing protein [Christensenellales bacterium]|jgi:hypothetical protein